MLSLAMISSVAFVGCSMPSTSPSAASAAAVAPSAATGGDATSNAVGGGRPASPGVVYVTSQGLYYDTFGTVDPLPMRGRFQLIGDSDGDGIADTMYGPGDRGYVGGRWWMDVNGNGVQDSGDHFFQCPLLGPGRTEP
jgi:hypothetical protein